jgi:hypothetical protein
VHGDGEGVGRRLTDGDGGGGAATTEQRRRGVDATGVDGGGVDAWTAAVGSRATRARRSEATARRGRERAAAASTSARSEARGGLSAIGTRRECCWDAGSLLCAGFLFSFSFIFPKIHINFKNA